MAEAEDPTWEAGRCSGTMYCGDHEHYDFLAEAFRRFAREGFSPILAVGFSQASALEKVAADFPKTQFSIIDSVVDKPNVQSVVFREHEGSFVVGVMGALASKTGKIGFVGGMVSGFVYDSGFTASHTYATANAIDTSGVSAPAYGL